MIKEVRNLRAKKTVENMFGAKIVGSKSKKE